MRHELFSDAVDWRNRWEVLRSLGSGTHGRGYAACRLGDPARHPCFLKVMRTDGPPVTPLRFGAEIAALAVLDHSGVPRLLESNLRPESPDSTVAPYLVTYLIEGPTVAQRFAGSRTLAENEGFTLAEGLLDILQHCHDAGLVHGDLKPENIILRAGSVLDPVVIDFSSTMPIGTLGSDMPLRLTQDPRFDLMQVARILIGCLTGGYGAPFRDWRARAPHQRPREAGGLHGWQSGRTAGLSGFFDHAFAIEPEERFQSAAAMRAALRRVQAVPPIAGRREAAAAPAAGCGA